jgi:hypothetical protein
MTVVSNRLRSITSVIERQLDDYRRNGWPLDHQEVLANICTNLRAAIEQAQALEQVQLPAPPMPSGVRVDCARVVERATAIVTGRVKPSADDILPLSMVVVAHACMPAKQEARHGR